MVFEEIIRHSPRRRASHSIAGGFRPTARAHTGLQQFSDTLTVVQVCRVTRDAPFSAKRRPKFISVTVSGARFRERSISSIGFNLCENCSTFRRISLVDHKRATWTPGALLYPLFCENDAMPKYISAYFLRRPKFISVIVGRAIPKSVQPCLSGSTLVRTAILSSTASMGRQQTAISAWRAQASWRSGNCDVL